MIWLHNAFRVKAPEHIVIVSEASRQNEVSLSQSRPIHASSSVQWAAESYRSRSSRMFSRTRTRSNAGVSL